MDTLRTLMRYKAWANELLFAAAAKLPETELNAPRGIDDPARYPPARRNHGTYHRGNVASMMDQAGVAPPTTDLPVFLKRRLFRG